MPPSTDAAVVGRKAVGHISLSPMANSLLSWIKRKRISHVGYWRSHSSGHSVLKYCPNIYKIYVTITKSDFFGMNWPLTNYFVHPSVLTLNSLSVNCSSQQILCPKLIPFYNDTYATYTLCLSEFIKLRKVLFFSRSPILPIQVYTAPF